jgi:hypothetical protein
MDIETKNKYFEAYMDDLRFLGAKIPYLHWDVTSDGNIYMLWDKMNDELEDPHIQLSDKYVSCLTCLVNNFNLLHQVNDEDL